MKNINILLESKTLHRKTHIKIPQYSICYTQAAYKNSLQATIQVQKFSSPLLFTVCQGTTYEPIMYTPSMTLQDRFIVCRDMNTNTSTGVHGQAPLPKPSYYSFSTNKPCYFFSIDTTLTAYQTVITYATYLMFSLLMLLHVTTTVYSQQWPIIQRYTCDQFCYNL